MMQAIAESGAGMSGASAVHMNMFGLNPVVVFGTKEQCARMLPPIVAGEEKACFAVTEPNTGLNTTQLKTRAVRKGDSYVVNGQKVWISTAQVAEKILLLARTTPLEEVRRPTARAQPVLHRLRSQPHRGARDREDGPQARSIPTSCSSTTCEMPVEDRIGEEGRGFDYILHGMNPERILIAAEAVGLGASRSPRAAAYAKERIVFDRPIGKNQGIQHPLAEELDGAGGGLPDGAAGRLAIRPGHACGPAANAAKYLAAEAGFHACEQAVMTHGGFGYAQGIPRRALPARIPDPAHRADQPAADPQLHRREGARPAEVVLR